ncbi:MAG: hypothetical protein ACN4GR_02020 [Arenicellales bacterium]
MLRGANKFSGMLLRLIFVMSLAVPVSPAMASVTGVMDVENDSSAHENCMNNSPDSAISLDAHAYAAGTSDSQAKNCQDSCCADDNCLCQKACLHFTAPHNLPLFSTKNFIFSASGASVGLSSAFEIQAFINSYTPDLRPPIG